jgi:hypothetical protein
MRIDELAHDIRVSIRSLLRHRAFTIVVIHACARHGRDHRHLRRQHGVLLRPLPYAESDRLVRLWQTAKDQPGADVGGSVSHVNYVDWKQSAKTLAPMALYSGARFVVTGLGDAEAVPAGIVTPDFFRVFKATPIVGREFTLEEDLPKGPEGIIVGYGFWKDRLGGRADVLSMTIEVSGRPRPVVGVALPGFDFARRETVDAGQEQRRAVRTRLRVSQRHARVAPDASVEAAQQEMAAIAGRLEAQFPTPTRTRRSPS